MNELSCIEISQEALRHNLAQFRAALRPGTKLAVVIKANAYGHGMLETARALEGLADYFQVDDAREFLPLSEMASTPILVLGYVPDSQLDEVVSRGGRLAVFGADRLPALANLKQPVFIHLAVDSLLGREGILPGQVGEFLGELSQYPTIHLEGIYSHFANIEDTSDPSHARLQAEAYRKVTRGGPSVLTHISATSGLMVHEQEAGNDLVRLGIGAYGIWPSDDLKERLGDRFQLRPALRWVTHVAQVKELPAGHPIGYGLTYVTSKPTKVALIPQGYSDGLDRGLSNTGEVLIGGTRCPLLGRVAMNMCVADVSHLPGVGRDDEVVILGSQGGEEITAEEIAGKLGTINYEVLARISPLLPRHLT